MEDKTKKQLMEEIESLRREVAKLKQEQAQRKQVEETPREAKESLSKFLQQSPDPCTIWDSDLNLIEASESSILVPPGTKKEDFIGKNILEIAPGLKETGRYDQYLEIIKTGKTIHFDDVIPYPQFGDLHMYVRAFKAGDGLGMIVTDITERKRVEEALRESEERYRGLFRNSLEALFTSDLDGNLKSCNAALEEVTGYTWEELSKMKPVGKIAPKSSESVLEQYQKVLSTGKPIRNLVYEMFRKDGQRRLAEGYLAPIRKENRIVGFQGAVRDITERKQAEQEVESSRQQLRNLAGHAEATREGERVRIARELHDEMGQTLTALKMELSWLNKTLSKDQISLREKTTSMSKLTDNVIQTVKRIATELRPGILDDLGLAAAVEWQAEEFQRRTGIECEVSLYPEDIILDEASSTAIFRILQETLTNVARHARATKVKISLQEKDAKLVLEVIDNGRGITEKQISDPKSLGLVGMRERVLPWQGEAEISGIRGEGTTVTVNIPLGEKGEIHDKYTYRR